MRVRGEDGTERAIHSLYDPVAEARRLAAAGAWTGGSVLVVLGVGLGYHLAEVSSRFPSAPVIAVEAHPEITEFQKSHGPPLGANVRMLTGVPADQLLREIAGVRQGAGAGALSILCLPSAVSSFPSYYRPLLAALEREARKSIWDRFRFPKFASDRVRVGLIDLGYFLNREVERALAALGHTVVPIRISRGQEGEEAVRILMEQIPLHRPDFLLTINHLGFDKAGILTAFLRSIEMPAAAWYIDNPNLVVKAFEANVSPYVAVFVWDKEYLGDVRRMGFGSATYLPLATDAGIFRPMRISSAERRVHSADVGFVGNSMWEPALRWSERVPPTFRPLVQETAQVVRKSRIPVQAALAAMGQADLLAGLDETGKLDFEGAVLWCATLLYRLSCVSALRGFHHRIHGDEGWKMLLHKGYRLGPRLRYYEDVPRFYNSCRMILNATSMQMGSAVNQRVFDAPACGAFLLTDAQGSLFELFEPGRECVCYGAPAEIPRLIRYYLRQPDAARRVALRARERVLAEHTYGHRLAEMIRVMRTQYGGGNSWPVETGCWMRTADP